MAGEDEIDGGNRDDEQLNYNSTNLSSNWPFNNPNDLRNSMNNIWDHHPINSQNLGVFCDVNLQNNAANSSSSSSLGLRNGNLDVCWVPPNSAMIPQSLSQFPADSGFIERAARLSSFSAGNFEHMINRFGNVPVQGQLPDEFVRNGFRSVSGEGCKDTPRSVDCVVNDGSQSKHGGSGFSGNNVTGEAEFSGGDGGGGGQDENSNDGIGSKKRRRSDQDTENNQVKRSTQTPIEATKNNNVIQQNVDDNPNSVANKSIGKHGKQVSQSSDLQKEEYIHVRARRGQATNSHSLAERVRREKISERMKFLQDLVPGCNKVTGKAVMLDEIINYVQSLQRQVEFLSMKLATLNPRMDFNLEGLLAKDIFESRCGPSSTLGFDADVAISYNHNQSQMAVIQGGILGVGRTINSHLMAVGEGYKDHASNVPSSWDDELHNIVHMGLNPSTPINNQNLESTPPGHLKAEP